MDSVIQERPLRELYLRPFEIAIREANPWAVMSSYNLVNGVHADMNTHTLKDILREEWGFEGYVSFSSCSPIRMLTYSGTGWLCPIGVV